MPEFRAPTAAPVVVARRVGELGFVEFAKACHRLEVIDHAELLGWLGLHGAVMRRASRPLDEGDGHPRRRARGALGGARAVSPRRGDLRDALEPAFRAAPPRRPWASPLAEEIARELASEPLGLPLAELGRRLRRREGDIRAELRNSPRFVPSGETKGRRWHLVATRSEVAKGSELRRSMPAEWLPARRSGQRAGISGNLGTSATNEPSDGPGVLTRRQGGAAE